MIRESLEIMDPIQIVRAYVRKHHLKGITNTGESVFY